MVYLPCTRMTGPRSEASTQRNTSTSGEAKTGTYWTGRVGVHGV